MATERIATISRETKETNICLELNLDGTGQGSIETGIPFLDHMLTLWAKHSFSDLTIKATGDLDVDYHHTVEDTGIVLGEAIKEALGEKRGITRYGFFILPMDETLVRVAIDLSNRPLLVYQVQPKSYYIRDFNIALVREFFQGLTNALGANVHIELFYGEEPHHIAEAIFKGFARALDAAKTYDARLGDSLPSTKDKL